MPFFLFVQEKKMFLVVEKIFCNKFTLKKCFCVVTNSHQKKYV